MILSDYDIHNAIAAKRIVVKPFKKEHVRENGLDITLDNEIAYRSPKLDESLVFDPTSAEHIKEEYIVKVENEKLVVPASAQVLLSTQEYLQLPDDIMGFIELRSTWARHGLMIPPTVIDAGFAGNITLAVTNGAPYAILLKPGMRFVHIVFAKLMNKATNSYRGAYLNQKGVWLPKVLK